MDKNELIMPINKQNNIMKQKQLNQKLYEKLNQKLHEKLKKTICVMIYTSLPHYVPTIHHHTNTKI